MKNKLLIKFRDQNSILPKINLLKCLKLMIFNYLYIFFNNIPSNSIYIWTKFEYKISCSLGLQLSLRNWHECNAHDKCWTMTHVNFLEKVEAYNTTTKLLPFVEKYGFVILFAFTWKTINILCASIIRRQLQASLWKSIQISLQIEYSKSQSELSYVGYFNLFLIHTLFLALYFIYLRRWLEVLASHMDWLVYWSHIHHFFFYQPTILATQ